jgi:AAT family amino acid transporter
VLVLVQGWSCFSPSFQGVDFVSFYIELPVMLVMFVGWKVFKRTKWVKLEEMDLVTDRYDAGMTLEEREEAIDKAKIGQWSAEEGWKGKVKCVGQWLFA